MPDDEMTMPSSDDMPEMPEFDAAGSASNANGSVAGLSNLLMQPGGNNQGGMWSPIQVMMRGSVKAEEYLPLTNVTEEDIPLHMQIMYFANLANYGNGKLEECIWAGYQLRRAIDGNFQKQIVSMVTGERVNNESKQDQRQAFLNRMRGQQQQGGTNPVGKLMS